MESMELEGMEAANGVLRVGLRELDQNVQERLSKQEATGIISKESK